jgi:hypothetical protein
MNKTQIAYLRAFHRKRQYTAAKPFVLVELIKKYKDLSWIEWMRLRWRNSAWVSNYNELIECVAQNCNFQMAHVSLMPQGTNFYWENHPHITEADVTQTNYFLLPYGVTCHGFQAQVWSSANLSMEFVLNNYSNYSDASDLGRCVSANPNVTIADVLGNLSTGWDMATLSSNPAFTMADFLANPLIKWSREGMALNPNITMADVRANPQIKWDLFDLSRNPNITIDDILNTDVTGMGAWDFLVLSGRANIRNFALRGKFSLQNTLFDGYEKALVLDGMMRNPHFTLCDLSNAGIEFPAGWIWSELSANPNLTLDFIEKHLHQLDIKMLTEVNKFLWDDVVYRREITADIAARSKQVGGHLREFTDAMTAGAIAQYIDWI